jgi:hypothetical protein
MFPNLYILNYNVIYGQAPYTAKDNDDDTGQMLYLQNNNDWNLLKTFTYFNTRSDVSDADTRIVPEMVVPRTINALSRDSEKSYL